MRTDESPGEVLVKVAYPSVNHKDALAGTAARSCASSCSTAASTWLANVAASTDPASAEGDRVLCTGWWLVRDARRLR